MSVTDTHDKCLSCFGTGQWTYGGVTGTCADCLGKEYVTEMDIARTHTSALSVLQELRLWLQGEVAAGDTSLQHWVDRIETVLPKDAATR